MEGVWSRNSLLQHVNESALCIASENLIHNELLTKCNSLPDSSVKSRD